MASKLKEFPRLETLAREFSPPTPQNDINFANRAAVLVCLFEGEDGDLRVILTKRASTLSSYSGEVSLPGGKAEEGDSGHATTALREAEEEIGLDPKIVTIITILEPFMAKNNVSVYPVIGFLANKMAFRPCLNPTEVEAIFDAPLEMFLKDENRRAEVKIWQGVKYVCSYFDFVAKDKSKYVIWALTAVILISSASLIYQRPPAFVENRPQIWSRGARKFSRTSAL